MSAVSYRVEVTAGSLSWTSTSGDYGLTDGLSITRSLPDSDYYPVQPNPAEAKFGVVVEEVADIIALDIDDPVLIDVFFPSSATAPSERFAGRVSDVVLSPHPLGVIANVTCVDFTVDLAELPEYTLESYDSSGGNTVPTRVSDLFAAYGLGAPPRLPFEGDPGPVLSLTPVWKGAGAFLDVLERYLAGFSRLYGASDEIPGRYVLMVQLDAYGHLDASNGYVLHPMVKPAADPRSPIVINGAHVDVGGSFTRTKRDRIDVIDISYFEPDASDPTKPSGSASVASVGDQRSAHAQIQTLLANDEQAFAAQLVYHPRLGIDYELGSSGDLGWRAESFTWRLKAEAPGTYLPNPNPLIPGVILGRIVEIPGIAARWSPVGTTYRGILAGYTLTLLRARPTVDLSLRNALEDT